MAGRPGLTASHGGYDQSAMAALDAPPTDHFRLTVRPARDEVHLLPCGDLDLATVERLEREVAELRSLGWRHLVVDLRGVGFLDSTALRHLLAMRNDARRGGEQLTLRPGPREVQRVFELTRTHGLFDWRP